MFNWKRSETLPLPTPLIRPASAIADGPEGFDPAFVRDIKADDRIAIQHPVKPGLTEMTVTRLFRPDSADRVSHCTVQWIGILTDGRKLHCSYEAGAPVWRVPRETTEAPGRPLPEWLTDHMPTQV